MPLFILTNKRIIEQSSHERRRKKATYSYVLDRQMRIEYKMRGWRGRIRTEVGNRDREEFRQNKYIVEEETAEKSISARTKEPLFRIMTPD